MGIGAGWMVVELLLFDSVLLGIQRSKRCDHGGAAVSKIQKIRARFQRSKREVRPFQIAKQDTGHPAPRRMVLCCAALASSSLCVSVIFCTSLVLELALCPMFFSQGVLMHWIVIMTPGLVVQQQVLVFTLPWLGNVRAHAGTTPSSSLRRSLAVRKRGCLHIRHCRQIETIMHYRTQ